jgi:hypothetical protein
MPPVSERPTARSAASAAVAIVEELTALRNEWPRASRTDQEKILGKVLGMVNDTSGSGTTKIPLRVAAKDFIERKASLDLLMKRVTEHVTARIPGQVLAKARNAAIDR